MKIIEIPIKEIKPATYNPRSWNENQIERLTESIKKFGMVEPLVVNGAPKRKNILIGGHFRLKIAKNLGFKEVPIVYVNIPNVEKEKELNLRLNKNTGSWDMEMLTDFDVGMLSDVGFDDDDLADIFPMEQEDKDDEVPEIPKKPKSKLGDIYQLGRHRIMCGDSTKREDVEKLMDGNKADMVFTDPPYALFGNSTGMSGVADDKMIQPFFREVFSNKIFSKNGCHWYTCCDWRTYPVMALCQSEIGLTVKQLLIWDKMSPAMGNLYRSQYECIAVSINTANNQGKLTGVASNKRRVKDTNVWQIKRQKEGLHNAEKPVEVICRAIENSSDRNNIVLDLFLGSGSTLIACEKTDRICYGAELDCRYVDVIIKRWEDYTNQKAKLIK